MSAQNRKPSGVLGGIAGLIAFSAIAGVLVTAMITPGLTATSAVAKSSISIFDDLPDYITIGEQSAQNQIFAMKGGQPVQIATIYKQNREEATWDQVSPFLKNAAIDGEDRRFYQHGGVDLPSVVRAAVRNQTQADAGQSGSSTLDMQLVRNILVQQALEITDDAQQKAAYIDAIKQTPDRKLREMKLAIGLDKRYTKKQILLGYLNIVGMGGTTYGVEAASKRYFSISAKDVTLAQAASLIAIVQQPNDQNLSDPKLYPANKLRRDEILKAMLGAKHITQKQYDDAVNTPIADEVKLSTPNNGCRAATDAPLACDYVSKIITSTLDPSTPNAAPVVSALGSTAAERKANWDRGGYKIYTSIDLDLQSVAQAALETWTPPTETRLALGAAADSVEVSTGRILVMAQNKIFDDAGIAEGTTPDPTKTAINFSTDHPYGNSNGFSTGSTFKIIDLANWLESGHGLGDMINGSGPQTYQKQQFATSCQPGSTGTGPFQVRNDGGSGGGTMSVKQGLIGSVNNVFMQMATRQDLCSIRDTGNRMGAHRADFKEYNGGTLEVDNPTMVLGTNEQAPLTMTGVGGTIGANGTYCVPIIIDSVVDPSGKKLPGQQQNCSQALTGDVAAGVANAMVGSMQSGTSSPANPRDAGVAIAGKTGTSPNADSDWVVATTTKIVTGVWTGNFDGRQLSLKAYTNPITHSNYYSVSRFQISKAIMKQANAMAPYRGDKAFPNASDTVLKGTNVTIPSGLAGQSPDAVKSLLQSLGFVYVDGGPEPSGLPAGQVSRTDPAEGAQAGLGQSVRVYTSDGTLQTTMPGNLSGKSRHDAYRALTDAAFNGSNISTQWVAGSPGDFCRVQSTDPSAGTTMSKSDPITLRVSNGTAMPGTDPGGSCPT